MPSGEAPLPTFGNRNISNKNKLSHHQKGSVPVMQLIKGVKILIKRTQSPLNSLFQKQWAPVDRNDLFNSNILGLITGSQGNNDELNLNRSG